MCRFQRSATRDIRPRRWERLQSPSSVPDSGKHRDEHGITLPESGSLSRACQENLPRRTHPTRTLLCGAPRGSVTQGGSRRCHVLRPGTRTHTRADTNIAGCESACNADEPHRCMVKEGRSRSCCDDRGKDCVSFFIILLILLVAITVLARRKAALKSLIHAAPPRGCVCHRRSE